MGHSLLLSGRQIASAKVIASAVASMLALAAVLVVAGRGPHVALPSAKTAPRSASLPLPAQAAISDALGRDRSQFQVVAGPDGPVAGNTATGMRASFGDHGALVRAGGATFGLRLLGYGPAVPRAHANRVTYRHGAITEWYANGPLGLEQGFDVARAPAGASGELALGIGLSGNVRARAAGSTGLTLAGPHGQNLSYTGLSATDARGRTLKSWLTLDGRQAVIHVRTAGAAFPVRVDPFIQVAKIGNPTPLGSTQLGQVMDVAGTTAAVTEAPASSTTPPPTVVDVFVANGGRWQSGATLVARLTDPDANPSSGFGSSVALTADARTLVVGAREALIGANASGKVYVYQEPQNGWTSAVSPVATLDDTSPAAVTGGLGEAVSISADGSTIAAGAPTYGPSGLLDEGAVDVYDRPAGGWTGTGVQPSATLVGTAPSDFFGWSVAISGNTIVTGANHAMNGTGAGYIFVRSGATWTKKATLPGDQPFVSFGWAAAISADAKTVVLTSRDRSSAKGAVFVYTSADGLTWPTTASAVLTAANPVSGQQLGQSVAIEGNTILSGAFGTTFNNHPFTGAAFVFIKPANGWHSEHEAAELATPDGKGGDNLGWMVGLSNGTAIVSAPGASALGTTNAQGFLYVYGTFPATSISLSPAAPNGSNGWYRGAVRITVSASDLVSTVNSVRCALNPASAPASFFAFPAACPFSPGRTVSGNGVNRVYAAASNTAGYASNPATASIKIDTGKPRVKCVPTPTFVLRGRGGLVSATVRDRTSGAAQALIGARAKVRKTGRKKVKLTGRDNAGNTTTVHCRYQVAAPIVPTSFPFGFNLFRNGTLFTSLKAKKVPKGATLVVTCKGRGCPLRRRTLRPRKKVKVCKAHHKQCKTRPAPPFATLNVVGLLKNRHLRPKTKLTLTVTKPNTIGVTQTFTMRNAKRPKITGPKCLAPGSHKPGKGCHS